jgi:hypothetical protein
MAGSVVVSSRNKGKDPLEFWAHLSDQQISKKFFMVPKEASLTEVLVRRCILACHQSPDAVRASSSVNEHR